MEMIIKATVYKVRDLIKLVDSTLTHPIPKLLLRLSLIPALLTGYLIVFIGWLIDILQTQVKLGWGQKSAIQSFGSTTSNLVTLMRAEGDLVTICSDPLAIEFLSVFNCFQLIIFLVTGFVLGRYLVSYDLVGRLLYGDEMLKQAIDDETIKQIVILGAGNDTRLHRISIPETISLFEVDAPTTQQHKLRHFADRALINPRVQFVSANFEKESWLDKLEMSGFDKRIPTLFIWEGVIMYLTKPAILKTLESTSSCAPGSKLIFDYLNVDRRGAMWYMELYLRVIGEPLRSLFDISQLETLLAEYGMRIEKPPQPSLQVALRDAKPNDPYFQGKIADTKELSRKSPSTDGLQLICAIRQ